MFHHNFQIYHLSLLHPLSSRFSLSFCIRHTQPTIIPGFAPETVDRPSLIGAHICRWLPTPAVFQPLSWNSRPNHLLPGLPYHCEPSQLQNPPPYLVIYRRFNFFLGFWFSKAMLGALIEQELFSQARILENILGKYLMFIFLQFNNLIQCEVICRYCLNLEFYLNLLALFELFG